MPQASPTNYIRSFNRFEFKYLVDDGKARDFADELRGFTFADEHSGPAGYRVHSVYWDSPDFVFFWEKVDGEKFRRKLRFRRYTGGAEVFIEIKQRNDRVVQKRRTLWPVDRTEALFGNGTIDPHLESEVDERVPMEALFLCRYHRLEPKMAVSYRRQAFFGAHETDLRVTFDRRLRYDAHALELDGTTDAGKTLFDSNLVVVEIKFNDRVPLWLTKLTSRHGFELTRLSKYCSAVDLEFFGGRFT
jgi:hypothetical protein